MMTHFDHSIKVSIIKTREMKDMMDLIRNNPLIKMIQKAMTPPQKFKLTHRHFDLLTEHTIYSQFDILMREKFYKDVLSQ